MPQQRETTEQTPLLFPPASVETAETVSQETVTSHDHDGPNQSVGAVRAVLIILSLWLLIFLQASNMSGLTTTQSSIAADLDAFSQASWFTSAYLIAMSSISPLAGRLSQIFSPRSCILVSSAFFAIGGFVTSQAPNFAVFVVGRAISGVGAAGIMTISIILVLELTSRRRRGLFIGLLNTAYTSGVSLGAVIAGALLPVTGWRAMFLVQSPLALLAGLGVFLSIPHSFTSGPKKAGKETLSHKLASIDYLGALTLTSSIVLFLFGLASAKIQWIAIVISGFLIVFFVLNEIYLAKIPIVSIEVLKSRGALLTCLAQLGFMAARWMVLFYTPVYAIAVRGLAPAAAGSILIPTNLGFALGGLTVGFFHVKRAGSFYSACLVAMTLFSVTLFGLSRLSTLESSPVVYVITVFANGFCTGAGLNYTLAHILHLTTPSSHFIASSLLATFRGFAGSFGSAIGGGLFLRVLEKSLTEGYTREGFTDNGELIRKLLGSPALVYQLKSERRQVAISGYVAALQALLAAGSVLGLVMVLIQAGSGWKAPTSKPVADVDTDGETP